MARTVATPRPRPSRRQAWLAGRCSPPTAGLEACAVGLAPLLVASAGLEACVASARRPRPARCSCSLPCRPGARGLLDGGAPRRVSGPCPSLHAAGRQEACADRPPPPAAGHPLPAAPRRKPLRPGRCSPSRPATRRAQPARRLRSPSRSARPPWWTAGRGSLALMAAAGDGRHRHPLLALAASATWLPWSPAHFALLLAPPAAPGSSPAQTEGKEARAAPRWSPAPRSWGVLWRRKRCHRFSPASGRRREEAWAAAAPLQSGTRLREEGGVGGGLERAVVAGGMSNRCHLCWDERRRFFLPTWTAWLAADLRGNNI
ncbi:hypothetical protein PVAP13_7KG277055 [Panicum virgatum]|uniref:Uncharacterized protein n=1 Tax=Panicum virgatum TaxID=38727 RepID=A0A8T0QKD9_PANVG|nr:hypothetical protein PVAP13_7KG277055 [Panicum virgatum]